MVEAIKSGKYPFMMCNFAPPDMVGHTGVYEAALIACAATGSKYIYTIIACSNSGHLWIVCNYSLFGFVANFESLIWLYKFYFSPLN